MAGFTVVGFSDHCLHRLVVTAFPGCGSDYIESRLGSTGLGRLLGSDRVLDAMFFLDLHLAGDDLYQLGFRDRVLATLMAVGVRELFLREPPVLHELVYLTARFLRGASDPSREYLLPGDTPALIFVWLAHRLALGILFPWTDDESRDVREQDFARAPILIQVRLADGVIVLFCHCL